MTPLVSVVTPVYQTPLPLFEETFRSLLKQTCGFERIEWLVAIHNMDDAYAASLKEITGERENVVFLRVEGGNSPSVPRNRCLVCSSGRYVFFLDSDDCMAPESIETVVQALEKSGAEIAVFDCAYIPCEDTEPLGRDLCLNAPDQELVVYEKGDPRILSLLAGDGAMLWSRAYRRELLLRSGVQFDEGARFGEDLLFNMAVEPFAEHVCALPRLKGCYHRPRTESMLQSALSSGCAEKEMAGYLPAVSAHGATELLWYHLSYFARSATRNGFDCAHLSEVRGALAPVLQELRVMAPRFSYTKERIEGMLALTCAVFSVSDAPRLRQRFELLETPLSMEEVRARTAAAAAENVELQTLGTEAPLNPFLGIAGDEACPEVFMPDLRRMSPDRQNAFMESYRRMELQRGFRDGAEVRCRITVFRLTSLCCALSITWDERFIGETGIGRLRDRICGDMGKYARSFDTVGGLIRHQAFMAPDKPAFCFRSGDGFTVVTMEELVQQMDALGAAIYSEDLRSTRIAVAAGNSYNWVLLYLTLLQEGMTVVTLDPALRTEELADRLKRTNASMVFLGDGVPEPVTDGVRCLRLSALPELIAKGSSLPHPDILRRKSVPPDAEAVILFTSGTTGYGKAAVISQKHLMTTALRGAVCREWYERTALCLPFSHILMQHNLLYGLYTGSEMLITSAQIEVMMKDFQAFRPQCVNLVPRLLNALQPSTKEMDLQEEYAFFGGDLKTIICSSAPLPEAAAEAFERLGICICNDYGSTETGAVAQSNMRKQRHGNAVYPLPGVEIRTDQSGEILIRSPVMFDGYLDDPDATARIIDRDGWLHSGDLGSIDPADGALTITGRLKNLIILSNGENVSPEELEDQLASLPLVAESLVFGDADERIVARIYPSCEGLSMEPEVLREVLREQIDSLNSANPRYMHIDTFYVSTAPLERNHFGKLKRTSN
jgi:long-chain acyl-CoA synthetase